MNNKAVLNCIIESFHEVIEEKVINENKRIQNMRRSSSFIKKTRDKIEDVINEESEIAVFSKHHNNDTFKRQEFLFDINVCKVEYITSPFRNKIMIPYISKSLIQIESELNNRLRNILEDFSKLVCGESDIKIFIAPKTNQHEKVLSQYKMVVTNIKGKLYLVILPKPGDWNQDIYTNTSKKYEIYEYLNESWTEIDI